MINLSVNINKIATIRNARGNNYPNVVDAAINCQKFGADGITVHPRPDERHITQQDVYDIKDVINTEYNIEGYPTDEFINLVLQILPTQVTLVPDPPDVLTSCKGWDTVNNKSFLSQVISEFQKNNIRTSIFIDPIVDMVEGAKDCGANRIELYTELYAQKYFEDKDAAIMPYVLCSSRSHQIGLEVNAGHDLSLENLEFFAANMPYLHEVSIGHALISDSLYLGLHNAIQMYKRLL